MVVIPWFQGDAAGAVQSVDEATGGDLARALDSKELTGRPYELFITGVADTRWKARRVMVMGAGTAAAFDPEMARRVASAAGLAVRQRRIARAALFLRTDTAAGTDPAALAQAAAEGLTLAEFNTAALQDDGPAAGAAPRGPSCTRRRRRRRRSRRSRAAASSASAATSRASSRTSRATR